MIRNEPVEILSKANQTSGLNMLAAVTLWELRRLRVNLASWLQAGSALLFFLALLCIRNRWDTGGPLVIVGTTNFGQLAELIFDLMLVYGVILPFLVADRVAHDYRERMHELLMTSAVPTWAYVGGRYLACLLVSLNMAVLMLAAQGLVNALLPAIDPSYPAAQMSAALVFWALVVLPSAVFVGSLCFSLGTQFPRYTVIVKVAACIAWVILALDQDPRDLGWRAYWNPTGAGMITTLLTRFLQDAQASLQQVTGAARQTEVVLHMQQAMPNLTPWLGPYLVLAGLGIVLATLSALGFHRFRDILG